MVARNGPSFYSTRNRVVPKQTYSYPKQVDTFRSYQDHAFINNAHRGKLLQEKLDEQLKLSNIIGNANSERLRNDYLGIAAPTPGFYNRFDEYEDMATKISFAKNILHKFMNTKEATLALKWLQDQNLIDTFLKFGDAFAKHSPKGITADEFQVLWKNVDTNIDQKLNPTRANTVRTISAYDSTTSPGVIESATKSSKQAFISSATHSSKPTQTPKYGTAHEKELAEAVAKRAAKMKAAEEAIANAAISGTEEVEVKAPIPAYTEQLITGKKGGPGSVAPTEQGTNAEFSAFSESTEAQGNEQDLSGISRPSPHAKISLQTYLDRIKSNMDQVKKLDKKIVESKNKRESDELKQERNTYSNTISGTDMAGILRNYPSTTKSQIFDATGYLYKGAKLNE